LQVANTVIPELRPVENHAPNMGGQVHGGEGYKQVGNNYKNSSFGILFFIQEPLETFTIS